MAELQGVNYIGATPSKDSGRGYHGIDPTRGEKLPTEFFAATEEEVDRAVKLASLAFRRYRVLSPESRAAFLDAIADAIEALGDPLLERASAESALPLKRLTGERGRTTNQLRMFADIVREGSWVEASIDCAIPDREPLPKPDLRRMLIPLGPVAVFGASNFPLAFSVAGGDSASALAAGCPIVVKAHPAHPGTSELVGQAILEAARKTEMPDGVFSLLHDPGIEVGQAMVRHPLTRAVAFTGSLRGGRALFDLAAARPDPIPVYAEMGSTNPVFVLPGALAERGPSIAEGLEQSVTLGVGQFCTNPGVVVGLEEEGFSKFRKNLKSAFEKSAVGTMLHGGIRDGYQSALSRARSVSGVDVIAEGAEASAEKNQARATALSTDAATFLGHDELGEEIFGPATLAVRCSSREELLDVARSLEGHLTATIQGTEDDLRNYRDLVKILETKVGRLLFNGFPTGVEVCPSVQHGGPYPSTTDCRTTSVGGEAIKRFARPICYQNFPDRSLPAELQDANPRGIWRRVDGKPTRNAV